ILTAQWELAKVKVQGLEQSYAAAQASLVQVELQGATLREAGSTLEQRAAVIRNQLAYERNPNTRWQLQVALNDAMQTYGTCQLRYQSLDAEAARLRIYGGQVESQLSVAKADAARIFEMASQLRTEWLAATNALEKLSSGDYPAAIAAFSEWIVLEADNAIPYFARGLAYLNSGRADLAEDDFQKASLLDPKTTAKMIREYQARLLKNGLGKKARYIPCRNRELILHTFRILLKSKRGFTSINFARTEGDDDSQPTP